MSKKKCSVLIDFLFKLLPLFILIVCIFSTWSGVATIEHCYDSLSFNIENGFSNCISILENFDLFNFITNFTSIVNAIDSNFIVSDYMNFIFLYFGYLFLYEVLKLLYYTLTFLFKMFSKFIERGVF